MQALNLEGIEEVFRPRLKLFLSVDIIGSTAYKQPLDIINDDPAEHALWAKIIQGFYKVINDTFSEHWTDASTLLLDHGDEAQEQLLGPRPRFWKTIGDEVVFWKELTDSLQIWMTLAAWLKTIESVRDYFKKVAEESSDKSANVLDVKPTAWLAEFPVRNKAIIDARSSGSPTATIVERLTAFYDDNDDDTVADFIGPGIDVGFRISALSSARKLSISLDLAYALAKSCDRMSERAKEKETPLDAEDYFPKKDGVSTANFTDRLRIHYSGSEQLKGVLGGIRYPRFWISCVRHGSLEEARVGLYNKGRHGREVDWGAVRDFCFEFYKDRLKFVSKPFIVGDPCIGEFPARYEEFLREAALQREDWDEQG